MNVASASIYAQIGLYGYETQENSSFLDLKKKKSGRILKTLFVPLQETKSRPANLALSYLLSYHPSVHSTGILETHNVLSKHILDTDTALKALAVW